MKINLSAGNLLSIFIYVVIIMFLLIAIWAESRDVVCPEFKSKKCGPGRGGAYAAGRPEKGDSLKILLQKIRLTARYEVNSIIWRRAFVVAVISSFLVLYVTRKKLPSGFQLATAFLISYIVLYLTLTTFQKVVTRPALDQLDDILSRIKHDTKGESFMGSPAN
jgi:hypothetical protein